MVCAGACYLYEHYVKPALEEEEEDDDEEEKEEEEEAAAAKIYEAELALTRDLAKELKAEHAKTDPLVSEIQRPRSGRYDGRSAEDDDGDQGVVTHLHFHKEGTIGGWGHDQVDGRYVIQEGVWSTSGSDEAPCDPHDGVPCVPVPVVATQPGARVAWIEKYDRGFEVALRGQVRADGTILALWASSVGVRGSVELSRS